MAQLYPGTRLGGPKEQRGPWGGERVSHPTRHCCQAGPLLTHWAAIECSRGRPPPPTARLQLGRRRASTAAAERLMAPQRAGGDKQPPGQLPCEWGGGRGMRSQRASWPDGIDRTYRPRTGEALWSSGRFWSNSSCWGPGGVISRRAWAADSQS